MKLYRHFTSQEDIDSEYKTELWADDSEYWFKFFVEESRKVREELQCVLDVPFGATLEETFDIFPSDNPGSPILVFIHGGYWRRLSSKEFSFIARGLVGQGWTVAVTNYALCPKVSLPEITRQSRAAVAQIARNSAAYNGNEHKIYVAGHSAGGQQVARLLDTDWVTNYGLPGNLIKGGYALSGVYDLAPLQYSWLQPVLQLDQAIVKSESPVYNIAKSTPPLLIEVGGEESSEFKRQSRDYYEQCIEAGLPACYQEQEGKHHFSVIEGFLDSEGQQTKSVLALAQKSES